MASIVEYTSHKRPLNAYPERIISPPSPSLCCQTQMERVGTQEEENGWPFFYKRCRDCGYTVRHFLPMNPELFQAYVREQASRRARLDAVA